MVTFHSIFFDNNTVLLVLAFRELHRSDAVLPCMLFINVIQYLLLQERTHNVADQNSRYDGTSEGEDENTIQGDLVKTQYFR